MEHFNLPERLWQSIHMDWSNLQTIKDASGKTFNQVLNVTDRGLVCCHGDQDHLCVLEIPV